MNGWQEPNDGKRIYLITDNTKMDGFTDYIKPEDIEHLYVTYSESRVNLGFTIIEIVFIRRIWLEYVE